MKVYCCEDHDKRIEVLLDTNEWNDKGLRRDHFDHDRSFGIISRDVIDEFPPRERILYEIIKQILLDQQLWLI